MYRGKALNKYNKLYCLQLRIHWLHIFIYSYLFFCPVIFLLRCKCIISITCVLWKYMDVILKCIIIFAWWPYTLMAIMFFNIFPLLLALSAFAWTSGYELNGFFESINLSPIQEHVQDMQLKARLIDTVGPKRFAIIPNYSI